MHCAWATVVFLAVLLGVPAAPPTPPSASAAAEEEPLSLQTMARQWVQDRTVTWFALLYGVPQGFYQVIMPYMAIILKNSGFAESSAAAITTGGLVGGGLASVLVGRASDRLGTTKPRNPRHSCIIEGVAGFSLVLCLGHFDCGQWRLEGGRKRVSDVFIDENSASCT